MFNVTNFTFKYIHALGYIIILFIMFNYDM